MGAFFKNAIIYKFAEGEAFDPVAAAAAMENFRHVPPASLDNTRYGFVAPFDTALVETAMGISMIAGKYSYKDLPASVINEEVAKKAKAIEEAESRSVGRKERSTLKDEVIFSMLPKAFVKHYITKALFLGEYIVVDASSAKRAEDLLSKLREALGSLKVLPVTTKMMPTQVMTHWITNGAHNGFIELGEACTLNGSKDGRSIRCKKQDLSACEVLNHINSGLYVQKISAGVRDKATFDINEKLVLSRIKFSDLVDDRIASDNPETKLEQQTSTMIVMGSELKSIINTVLDEFGGIVTE